MSDGISPYSGQRFRRAIGHFLLGRAAQVVANFALILWLVRLLAPADYGAYMILWGMVEMMVPLSSLGMLETVRRYLPDLAARGAPGALPGFLRVMTLARLALMICWALGIAFFWAEIAAWLGFSVVQQEASQIAVCLVVSVIGFRYASEMLECLLEQRWSQLTQALLPVGRLLGVMILVALESLTLARVFWVDIAVSAGCFLLAEFFLIRRVKSIATTGNYRVSRKEVATFAWHMAGFNVLNATASIGALRLLVGRLLGLELAGLFAFLQQLLVIVGRYLPANLLANLIRPMLIAHHADGGTAVIGQGVALMWKTNLLIVLSCVAVFAVAGDVIIALASGGRFQQAGLVMLLLFLGLGATTQGQLVAMFMQIHKRTHQLRNQSMLALLVPVAAWVGAGWGLAGVALGIVLAQWVRNSFALWWLRKHGVGIELDGWGVLRMFSVVVLAGGLGYGLVMLQGSWLGLAATLLLLGVGVFLARPLNRTDYDLLMRALKGKVRFLKPLVWRAS